MLLDHVRELQGYLRLPYPTKTNQSELLAVIASNQLLFQLFQLLCPTDKPLIWRRNAIMRGSGAAFDWSAAKGQQKMIEVEKH